MDPAAAITRPRRKQSTNLMLAGTMILSVILLAISLKGIEFSQFREDIEALDWRWVALAVIADVMVYVWHGFRWSLLLTPITNVSPGRCTRAIYVGLYANEVLPFRTGEVIRCYLLARWTEQPFSVMLSSALIERIFDGIWLLACLVFTLRFVQLPSKWVDGGIFLAVVIGVIALIVAYGMYDRHHARDLFGRYKYLRKLVIVIDDLHLIGHSRYLYFAALASLPYLLLQMIPIYALAQAYNLNITLLDSLALLVILRLSAVVPLAPGNLGLFQLATIQGLLLFAVEKDLAQRFSFVLWSVVTIPLLVVGCIALAVTGLKIRELSHEAQSAKQDPHAEP